jgi:hypothetical protein
MIQWLLVLWICHPGDVCSHERVGYYKTQELCMKAAGWNGRRQRHPSWKCVMICCEPSEEETEKAAPGELKRPRSFYRG